MEEKYNRWNDKHTSINPFIEHKQKGRDYSLNIFFRILLIIIAIIKLPLLVVGIILLLLSTLISILIPITFIQQFLIYVPGRIVLLLMGVYKIEDFELKKVYDKNSKKALLIISNSVSFIDGIYYIIMFSRVRVIMTHSYINKTNSFYEIIGPTKIIIRLLFYRQPFFKLHTDDKQVGDDLSSLMKVSKNNHYNLVCFYQGIRTNGVGTLEPKETLVDSFFKLSTNLLFVHLKYSSSTPINSLVKHPFSIMFDFCCSPTIILRIRSSILQFQQINSYSQLRKQLKELITLNGSRILDVKAESYFEFIQYYCQKN